MPGNGMAQMIQLISTLSDMQSKRRQLDLEEARQREQHDQFTQSLGFQKGSEQYKQVMGLYKEIQAGGPESRPALIQLGQALGFDQSKIEALAKYGENAPLTKEFLSQQAANRGAAQATPASDMEAYLGATSGMNRGQQASSGLQSAVATGAEQQFQQSQQPGADTALQAAGKQAMFGATPGWSQFQQADIGRGGLAEQRYQTNAQLMINARNVTAQANSAKALGFLSPEARTAAINTMRDLTIDMTAKGRDDASRLTSLAMYNRLAAMIDPTLILPDPNKAPNRASLLERIEQFVRPPAFPSSPPQVTPGASNTPLQNPFNFMDPQAGYNPLTPFLQRPYSGGQP